MVRFLLCGNQSVTYCRCGVKWASAFPGASAALDPPGARKTPVRFQGARQRSVEVETVGATHPLLEASRGHPEHLGLPVDPRLDAADQTVSPEEREHVVPVLARLLGGVDLPDVIEVEELPEQLPVPHQRIQRC